MKTRALCVNLSADTSVGDVTCHGGWSPGSLGHWEEDANTFASWGVDYVRNTHSSLSYT
jgi:hypothetical protein